MPESSSTEEVVQQGFPASNNPDDTLSPIELKRRKISTKWKQQNLPAFRHHISFLHLLIYYLTLGVLFIVIGCACYAFASKYPKVIREDYTDCSSTVDNNTSCSDKVQANRTSSNCSCTIEIEVQDDLALNDDPIILYYELTEFHQNIRSYRRDFDENQLVGKIFEGGVAVNPDARCKKYYREREDEMGKPVYPCGKIANSYFSDVFVINGRGNGNVSLDSTGIAWLSDKQRSFKNPKNKNWAEIETHFSLPRDWHKEQKNLFKQQNGIENERFIVWMRTAAFKTFRKKYAIIKGLEKGNYTITVSYRFDAVSYGGRKYVVIAAATQFGMDLPVDFFFFNSYISVGAICIVLGPMLYLIEFLAKRIHKQRILNQAKIDEGTQLGFEQEQDLSEPEGQPRAIKPSESQSSKSTNAVKSTTTVT